MVILKESNGSTLHVLCVNCSILVLTQASPTSPIPFLMIQRILVTIQSTLIVLVIAGAMRGTFGAGGSVGKFIFMLGITEGSSGNFGGAGISGREGREMFAFNLTVGGHGRSGSDGRAMFFGTNWMFGITTSIPARILLRST
ncbi:MAG: hypothetical protein WCJ81_06215 [bacterium]